MPQEATVLQHEVQVERQMRTQLQLALTGAHATIRQLRAAPTPPPRTAGSGASSGRRRSEPGSESSSKGSHPHSRDGATAHSNASSGRSLSLAGGMGGGARGVRDSVCRQLLQSPASTLSTVSFAAKPTRAAGCSPLSQPDAACSPKELPLEGHPLRPHHHGLEVAATSPKVPQAHGGGAGPAVRLGAGQQSLSGWMLTALATPGADGGAARTAACTAALGRTTAAALAELQTPAPVGRGQGAAAAVRAALAATPAQPLTYGSPLHRRIQRLLAAHGAGESLAPSPLSTGGAAHVRQVGTSELAGRQLDPGQLHISSVASSSTSSACATPAGGHKEVRPLLRGRAVAYCVIRSRLPPPVCCWCMVDAQSPFAPRSWAWLPWQTSKAASLPLASR